MAFKTLFLAHAPDADYEKHQNMIDTGKYKLWTFVVKNQEEAIKISKSIYKKEKIDAIILWALCMVMCWSYFRCLREKYLSMLPGEMVPAVKLHSRS